MSERVFNIFIYFDGGRATEYGVRHYRREGNEKAQGALLKASVASDHGVARRFPLPRSFTPQEWLALQRRGLSLSIFEEAFQLFRAPREPIICITAIVDGDPKVEKEIGIEPYQGAQVTQGDGFGTIPDYLVTYTEGAFFRFDKLMNDDYFTAMRLLFQAGHFVSANKLLMSCIDTLAFVEFGDVAGNFAKWLDAYVDLSSVGITSSELWELRNSLLHMTNLASRAVIAGKVSPIMPYVGPLGIEHPTSGAKFKPFNLKALIDAIVAGISKWANSYNEDRDKFLKFVERYDTTISDSRIAPLHS